MGGRTQSSVPPAERSRVPTDHSMSEATESSTALTGEPGWGPLVRQAGTHKDARLGAALAYYSVFSLGPLIVIASCSDRTPSAAR
jgi:hypothetical protein